MTGFGGVVTFEVKGGLAAGSRLVDACRVARIAPSLGGVETLIEQPALMSFYELTTEQRLAIGIKDELVRLAVGIEDVDDLIGDLSRALDAAQSFQPQVSRGESLAPASRQADFACRSATSSGGGAR